MLCHLWNLSLPALKDTESVGNLYFANFSKYLGIITNLYPWNFHGIVKELGTDLRVDLVSSSCLQQSKEVEDMGVYQGHLL